MNKECGQQSKIKETFYKDYIRARNSYTKQPVEQKSRLMQSIHCCQINNTESGFVRNNTQPVI